MIFWIIVIIVIVIVFEKGKAKPAGGAKSTDSAERISGEKTENALQRAAEAAERARAARARVEETERRLASLEREQAIAKARIDALNSGTGARQKISASSVVLSMTSRSAEYKEILETLPRVQIIPDTEAAPLGWVVDEADVDFASYTKDSIAVRAGDFVAVDVETSGLDPVRNEILELAAVRFRGFQPIECFHTYIRPRYGIQPRAAAVNGITEGMVAAAPYIEQVRDAFRHFVDDAGGIVGHNISFDLRFLYAGGCLEYPCNLPVHDTLQQSRRVYKLNSYRLDYLDLAVLGISRRDAHSALSDALTTGLLFREICARRTARGGVS